MPLHGSPVIWLVSDGRAGHNALVRSIGEALAASEKFSAEDPSLRRIQLTPQAPWTWLPGPSWPMALSALRKSQRRELNPPWPDIWIGAGRRIAPYTNKVRSWSGHQTFTVQILDAGLRNDRVDLQVIPEHDQVSGENMIQTVGSPAFFSPADIDRAKAADAEMVRETRQKALVLLGGPSKTHTFDQQAADRIINHLDTLAEADWAVFVSASSRTPASIRKRFVDWSARRGATYWDSSKRTQNPYISWLSSADIAVVTEDSANMISEAAFLGCPIYLARLSGHSDKFDRMHAGFIERGYARWLEVFDANSLWTYSPLREAERVASEIIQRWRAK